MLGSRLTAFVKGNLPSQKPQLWDALLGAVARKVVMGFASALSAEWMDRPRLARLSDERLRMEVVPRDQIGRSIYLYGVFEVAVTRLVRSRLRLGDVFVDVGANSGYYTVIAGDLVGPTGKVHAFEPVDALRARLLRNVALNGLQNCCVRPEAVWRTDGEVSFFESSLPDNSGLSSVMPGPGRTDHARTVPATTLDEIARRIGKAVALVKIDVEGGEMAVLEGGCRLLESPEAPTLIFESYDVGPAASFLGSRGYEVRRIAFAPATGLRFPRIGDAYEDPFSFYEAPNYLALKPGAKRGRFDEIH